MCEIGWGLRLLRFESCEAERAECESGEESVGGEDVGGRDSEGWRGPFSPKGHSQRSLFDYFLPKGVERTGKMIQFAYE